VKPKLLSCKGKIHGRYLLASYVPPEQDPEYRISPGLKATSPSSYNGSSDIMPIMILPLPSENDIVKYPSKWLGTFDIGRLRSVYSSASGDERRWMCEIIPMVEGKSDNVLTIDKKAKLEFHPLTSVQPVRSYFVRSENGYRVSFKANSSDVILKAPMYKIPEQNFEFRRVIVNSTEVDTDFRNYSALKNRIIRSTIYFGLFMSASSWILFGSEVSIPLLFGSFCGALYFFLLGLKTDSVGQGTQSSCKLDFANKVIRTSYRIEYYI
jgi:hypothetical protein